MRVYGTGGLPLLALLFIRPSALWAAGWLEVLEVLEVLVASSGLAGMRLLVLTRQRVG